MNFPILLHLLKSDWQRLKRPLVVLWLLLFLAALPWLLHRPGTWQMPEWTSFSWQGEMKPIENPPMNWTSSAIHITEFLATVLALILAATLGAQWVKQPVTPIRRRDRMSALALSLLVFMVLPLWFLAGGNLLLHGFSPGTAAIAAGFTALTAWMLLALFAAFAAWLPSPWLLLPGCAALATSVGFISEFYRPLDFIIFSLPVLPTFPAGPREWLFGAFSIALLTLLFPVSRRMHGPWKIVIANLVILAAGIPAILLPPLPVRFETDLSIATAPIHPVLEQVQIQMENGSSAVDASPFLISANIKATGCPPGQGVRFEPISGWISQNGKRIATVQPKVDPYLAVQNAVGYFTPDGSTNRVDEAVQAALPGGTHAVGGSESVLITVGESDLPADSLLSPDQDAELHMTFRSIVFRYETVWDTALNDRTTTISKDHLTWRMRRSPSSRGEPRADVMVTWPGLGLSPDMDEIRWPGMYLEHYPLYFHLPASGINLHARDRLLSASGPLFSSAGWERRVLTSEGNEVNRDLTGLRLIALRPVVVAQSTTTTATRFRPWRNDDRADYDLTYRYLIDDLSYRRDFFPARPDPLTCTRGEFARWLQIAAHVFPGASGSEHDLAAFAPRFAGLMAKVAHHRSVGMALRLGTPEAMREEIIGQLDSVEWPDRLADVALARGWRDEARDGILRRFQDGGIREMDPVMALEEPSTYPQLISRFLGNPERETYEKLRLLPGIEPQLGQAITKAMREKNLGLLRDNLTFYQNSAPYGPFLYAAKRGDPAALEAVLQLYLTSGEMAEYAPRRDLGYVVEVPDLPGDSPKPQMAWLHGKTAASFRFDPLLRLWKPLP